MADQDFKYVIQDLTNVYIGARYTYEEMLEDDNVPHKLKEVIVRILLTEVAPDTTPENHIFYMTPDSASFKACKKMKARFKMSVWQPADGRKHKKSRLCQPGILHRRNRSQQRTPRQKRHHHCGRNAHQQAWPWRHRRISVH